MNKMSDVNSDEWDKIRNWVGGAKPKAKHPLVQEADRMKMKQPQHLDDGGMVDPLSDASKNLLAPQGAGVMAPSPFQSAAPAAAALTPLPPVAARPPVPQAPPPAPIAPAQAPGPETFNQGATSALGGIDPAQIKAFLEKVNTPTGGEMIGRAGSTLGDALTTAAGNHSNYADQFNQVTQQNKENLSGIPGKVADVGEKHFGLSQKLEAQDPSSQYSRVVQKAYGPSLIQLGIPPSKVAAIPAAVISDILDKKVTAQEALARIQQEGSYQRGMLENTRQSNNIRQQEVNEHEEALGAEHPFGKLINSIVNGDDSSAPKPVPDGRVTVVSPDGVVGHIPQSQLKEAMARGYKAK